MSFRALLPAACVLVGMSSAWAGTIQLEIDSTDLPRRLLHARLVFPVSGETLTLWYPRWLPGIHAPGGPIQNLVGLRFESPRKERLEWRRNEEEPERFACALPKGITQVMVYLDYICNQSTPNSVGVDSFGNSKIGVLNWNTCLLYPEGDQVGSLRVQASLKLPKGWRHTVALPKAEADGDWLRFPAVPLTELLDSPVIAGEFLRTLDLSAEGFPPTFLHLTSEAENAIEIDEETIRLYRNLVVEAKALFGVAHYPEYHFLAVLSNEFPKIGLEHLASSLNIADERSLVDEKKRKDWVAYLLPHEYVHSWCGKYRRPRGMTTPNFHVPQHTELLWVYEGLTQYLGEILTVRSGFLTPEEYLDRFTQKVGSLMRQTGREWRPLVDTAISTHLLRGGSPNWAALRRNQDYYNEGLLLWMEADAIIRGRTDGRKSLDDFCRQFLGRKEGGSVLPYDIAEVYSALRDQAEWDWEGFFSKRVSEPQQALPLDVIGMLGYRLQYSPERSKHLKDQEEESKSTTAADSLGLDFNETGGVVNVVPGMPGDRAGFSPGMTVQGINGRKFSRDRVHDALADSIATRRIEFLVLEGDRYRTLVVDYADGPKYLQLARDEDRRDLLAEILKPRIQPR